MSEKIGGTIPVPYYADNIGLNTDDVKRPINQIDDLLTYLATIRKRWGNTAVTCKLQWGAAALWMRSEQAEQCAALTARLEAATALIASAQTHIGVANEKWSAESELEGTSHAGQFAAARSAECAAWLVAVDAFLAGQPVPPTQDATTKG